MRGWNLTRRVDEASKSNGGRQAVKPEMTDLFDLSAPALAVQRATEAGSGVLSKGRSWVQYEGSVSHLNQRKLPLT